MAAPGAKQDPGYEQVRAIVETVGGGVGAEGHNGNKKPARGQQKKKKRKKKNKKKKKKRI